MIRVESTDGIALVRFERPPANAIELESATKLEETLARLEAEDGTRAVVLTGHGEFFSAGLDLKVVPTYGPEQQRTMVMAINRLVGRLYGLGLPTVAAVNGHAIAGGLVVVLACDFRIGRRGSYRLGLTETRAAVPYPVAAMTVVTTELAPAVARRAVLLARNGTPENALADGILDEVQDGEAIIARALDVARELAALPRSAYASIKRQLRATALERIAAVLATGADPLVETWLGAETASAAAELLGRAG
ncbi:MAG: enoyl-CoA hydratase/isomerase family protein [Deltaproteobacteria bacterium]|nr:MAG: enoyl-CoA hydratase/isomerase family protein [Deltaproteobacteria bacterium]